MVCQRSSVLRSIIQDGNPLRHARLQSSMRRLLLFFACATTIANAQPPIAAIKTELAHRYADSVFSGAVLITKAGKPLFQAAYGYADREKQIPNTLDTKFRFGSMGKMFTGIAIVQLVQAGKINLDDPLGKYLTDYPNHDVAKVTIYQLLTHTGGTGDIFGPEFNAHWQDLHYIRDYIALLGPRGLDFPPGSKWAYSNYGYMLLGRVIEVVSGQSYDAYVQEHIFAPAGMHATGEYEVNVPGLSVPYTRGGPGTAPSGPLQSAASMLPDRGTSAGGGYSTVGDFLRFATALTTNRLLNAQYTTIAMTGKVETTQPGVKWAFGMGDVTLPNGVHRIGHSGGAPGQNGRLYIYPASGYVVVVLANLDPPAADSLGKFIDSHLVAN
jgi:D-alanyl-D-alanine carboxypeptidase